jgi:hypothetical protein
MRNKCQVAWGDTRLFVFKTTPQKKIDEALSTIKRCQSGHMGFAFRNVHRYPMADGRACRSKIATLKTERMNAATTKKRGDVITLGLKKLRKLERGYWERDEKAYRTLRANFDKLKRALSLLVGEGEIDWYHLKGDGYLTIGWFTGDDTTKTEVVYQGGTYQLEYEPNYFEAGHRKESLYKNVFALYGMKPITKATGFQPPELLSETCMHNTGYTSTANLVSQRITRGSGEYDPYSDMYRDKVVFKPDNPVMYLDKKEVKEDENKARVF